MHMPSLLFHCVSVLRTVTRAFVVLRSLRTSRKRRNKKTTHVDAISTSHGPVFTGSRLKTQSFIICHFPKKHGKFCLWLKFSWSVNDKGRHLIMATSSGNFILDGMKDKAGFFYSISLLKPIG
ncbi:hypothetical protein L3Y34_012684 [Caenorhabditis briggsae]|uniref:Secreted protein n=1 Tax=Caenorhabditis briggsae TaxID=6238 RepID=A0AAE8ZTB7_CAEBR|nr:hypothetical protein L3Y34_012684 [Caenorhabditis briggsae]